MKSFTIDLQSYQIHRDFCQQSKHPVSLGQFQTPKEAIQYAQIRYQTHKICACYFCSKDYFNDSGH